MSRSRALRAALQITELPASHLTVEEFAASIFQSGLLVGAAKSRSSTALGRQRPAGRGAGNRVETGDRRQTHAVPGVGAAQGVEGSAAHRQLRDSRHARHGRNGAYLQGAAPLDEPRRGPQALAGLNDERPRHGKTVSAGSAGGRCRFRIPISSPPTTPTNQPRSPTWCSNTSKGQTFSAL